MTAVFPAFIGLSPGQQLLDGGQVAAAVNADMISTDGNVTALGSSQVTGYQIVAEVTEFTTVAASTVACLPKAIPGAQATIFNFGASTLTIFPYGGIGTAAADTTSTIDGGSAGASVSLTAAHRGAVFICVRTGVWRSSLVGAVSS